MSGAGFQPAAGLSVPPLSLLLLTTILSAQPPELIRLHPLGAQRNTSVEIEILGTHLDHASTVEFDCSDLTWKHTTHNDAGRLTGIVSVAPGTALGGHMLRVITPSGPSTALLFNAGQYPAMIESDHRTVPALPIEIYGRLDGAADSDQYWFTAKAGERWLFDLRAMEHGSAVEARMILLDATGARVGYNDDRDHYDENPLIEHTFAKDGVYAVKLDQYRGPRGFTFGKNNGYTLRISALPRVRSVTPLGARRGLQVRFNIDGSALERVDRIWLTELRRGEYQRMTYPYTMPIHFQPDPTRSAEVPRIGGKLLRKTNTKLEATFAIPATAKPGLWKLWLAGPAGTAEGPNLEIGDAPEISEADPLPTAMPFVVNGVLAQPRERDRFTITAKAGVPLHFSTLSAQLGGPFLDTVLTLRDTSGKKLAESDDVVAGWGGLLGNPDSSLFYTPKQNGPIMLEVRDRLNRGGPLFPYRLKADHAKPGFQLFTGPENLTARRGAETALDVYLVREAGFEGEVEIWCEGLPPDVPPLRSKFRADHVFEPNADGADMIIPKITFNVRAPASNGSFPFRVLGKAASGATAEAHTVTMIGPIYQGDWNFYRRPVPAITLTVVD
ncbi:MAG: hypothetical protein U0Q16_14305 [Bryobacteraceae bacterium]